MSPLTLQAAPPIYIMLYFLAVLLFSAILHEVAHGVVALKLGDPTAKDAGRLTLNPVKHIDALWSLLLPLMLLWAGSPILMGGAKPVPYDPRYFSNYRKGVFAVGIAGVAVNFALAIFFGLVIRLLDAFGWLNNITFLIFFPMAWINIMLGVFNLIPLPPIDGFKVVGAIFNLPFKWQTYADFYGQFLLFPILLAMYFLGLFDVLIWLMLFIFYLLTGISFFS